MRITDYSDKIAEQTGHTQKDIIKILRSLEIVMRERILFGESISFKKIGIIHTMAAKPRKIYNVNSKTYEIMPKRIRLGFKPNYKLKKDLDKKKVYV